MKYNMLVKPHKEKEFLITDFIVTKLTKNSFEKLQKLNAALLGDYRFVEYKNTDFSWWSKASKYLTASKLKSAAFDVDFYGNVTLY